MLSRNDRIKEWVIDTAAAQADTPSSRPISPWPRHAPRTFVENVEDLPSQSATGDFAVSEHFAAPKSPRPSSQTSDDAIRVSSSSPERGGCQSGPHVPYTPLLDNLTTPATISAPNSALWPTLTLSGIRTCDENNTRRDSLLEEEWTNKEIEVGNRPRSEMSAQSTVVPPIAMVPWRMGYEAPPRLSNVRLGMELQGRRAVYSPSIYSRLTDQSMNWDDGISVNHPYEEVMLWGRNEPLDTVALPQMQARMREVHFARQQIVVSCVVSDTNGTY